MRSGSPPHCTASRGRRALLAALLMGACRPGATTPDAALRSIPDAGADTPAVLSFTRVSVKQTPDDRGRTLTLLSRGERVTITERGEPYCRVRLSDGTVGYVQTRNLLVGPVVDATLLMDQDLYVRPDALSPVRRRATAGTLVFVLADKDGWRQLQLADRGVGWVPRDKAVTEPGEVEAARALWRSDLLLEQQRPDLALTALRDYLAAHSGARLSALVEARVGTIDAGPGPAAPADGSTAPSAADAAGAAAKPDSPAPAGPVTPAAEALDGGGPAVPAPAPAAVAPVMERVDAAAAPSPDAGPLRPATVLP